MQLRAEQRGFTSDLERAALEATYAYEEVLREKNGKKTRAGRTWQMFERHGVVVALERMVDRDQSTAAYDLLVDLGLQEFTAEAIILRFDNQFPPETVERSKKRLAEQKNGAGGAKSMTGGSL